MKSYLMKLYLVFEDRKGVVRAKYIGDFNVKWLGGLGYAKRVAYNDILNWYSNYVRGRVFGIPRVWVEKKEVMSLDEIEKRYGKKSRDIAEKTKRVKIIGRKQK